MNNKIKIVDISTLIPGPFASFLLRKHLRAEVLKIEDINQPDALINMRPTENGIGLGYSGINSEKKILRVDMRKDGVERIKQEIQDGVYLTPEMIDEVATRLAVRFLKKM